VKEYSVRRDGTLIATVPVGSTTYLDTALTPATTYAYTVRARDVANNTSVDSNTANGTTDAVAGDTTPPTAPANLIVTGQTSSTIDVAWDASTDNVAVTGYIVYRQQPTTTAEITCDVDPQSVSTTTFVDYGATPDVADGSVAGPTISTAQNIDIQLLGLTPNTVYWYRVRAANTNGTSISKLGYFIVPSTTPATFYVSPTGLDTGTGDGTLAHPYATLQKAFTRCQTTGGDQVVMLAGSYGSQTMTKNFTGLTLVKPAPGATVNIASVAFTSGCRLVAFIGVNCRRPRPQRRRRYPLVGSVRVERERPQPGSLLARREHHCDR
jgi:chitodextrinase